jgi:hypothetical protein
MSFKFWDCSFRPRHQNWNHDSIYSTPWHLQTHLLFVCALSQLGYSHALCLSNISVDAIAKLRMELMSDRKPSRCRHGTNQHTSQVANGPNIASASIAPVITLAARKFEKVKPKVFPGPETGLGITEVCAVKMRLDALFDMLAPCALTCSGGENGAERALYMSKSGL